MGWTGYILVYSKSAANQPEVRARVEQLCSKYLVLPGSEPLWIPGDWTDGAQGHSGFDARHLGYKGVIMACSKVQSSINPMLSLWSMMRIAKKIFDSLGEDFIVEFDDDYQTYRRPVDQLTFLDFFLYAFMAIILSPYFLVINFRVLFER